VVSKGAAGNWEWEMGVQSAGLPFFVVWDPNPNNPNNPNKILEALSSASLSLGLWHHLVAVVDKMAAKPLLLYVDDASPLPNLSPSAGNERNGTAPLEIGRRAGSEYWPGSIDEVAFYSTALSEAQVLAHITAAR